MENIMRKRKYKHKHKEKRYYLSDRRAFNDFVRHNKKFRKLIKAFREQVRTLAGIYPF